jgi:hypothetical protein
MMMHWWVAGLGISAAVVTLLWMERERRKNIKRLRALEKEMNNGRLDNSTETKG